MQSDAEECLSPKRLRDDFGYRAELDYCFDHGIPHSVYLGRVVGRGQPEWLDEDREKVEIVRIDRAARCHSCGTYEEESRDEDGFPLPVPLWEPTTYRCLVCEAMEQERDGIDKNARGVTVRLKRAGEED